MPPIPRTNSGVNSPASTPRGVQKQAPPDLLDSVKDLVIDIHEVKETYKHHRLAKNGYKGLVVYLVFLAFFVVDLRMQQHEPSIGQVNTGLRNAFNKAKADLLVSNTVTMWTFMSTKIVSFYLGPAWTDENSHDKILSGSTSNEFYYLLGDLVITAVKSTSKECFRGQVCYFDETLKDPFVELNIPAVNKTAASKIRVPYQEFFGGYSVSIPGSASAADRAALLAAYAPLFGPDTRKVRFDAILFNPHGHQTLSSVTFMGETTVEDIVTFYVTLDTIPYRLYSQDFNQKTLHLILEGALVVMVCYCFVRPFYHALFTEPEEKDKAEGMTQDEKDSIVYENMLRRLKYLAKWENLPIGGTGKVLWEVAASLWITFAIAVCLWMSLAIAYGGVPDLDDTSQDTLFENPLEGIGSTDTAKKVLAVLEGFQRRSLPFITNVTDISIRFQIYFLVQTLVVLLGTVRFFQYLTFQRRLSVVTDTFSGIFDDLLHLVFVLVCVCMTVAVMASLSYGSLDPGFQTYWPSFFEMVESCFGLYKPAATMQFNPALTKYVPHVLIHNGYMAWAPLLLQLFFKLLVMLLLFKLLMGVIMEGYKKHKKDYPHTMRSELKTLGSDMWYYLWCHRVRGQPHVPIEHMVLALNQISNLNQEDKRKRPWRTRFVGFTGGLEAVQDALNAVFVQAQCDPAKWPKMRAIAKFHHLKRCGPQEAAYVLMKYGVPRRIAQHHLASHILKTETERFTHELMDPSAGLRVLTQEEKIQQEADAKAKDALEEMERKLVQACNSHKATPRTDRHSVVNIDGNEFDMTSEFNLDFEQARMVFNAFDFYGTGQVDIRFMGQMLGPSPGLGFDITPKMLGELIAKYDDDENQCFDWKEVKVMLEDPELRGSYVGERLRVKRNKDERASSKTKGLLRSLTKFAILGQKSEADHQGGSTVTRSARRSKTEPFKHSMTEPLIPADADSSKQA